MESFSLKQWGNTTEDCPGVNEEFLNEIVNANAFFAVGGWQLKNSPGEGTGPSRG